MSTVTTTSHDEFMTAAGPETELDLFVMFAKEKWVKEDIEHIQSGMHRQYVAHLRAKKDVAVARLREKALATEIELEDAVVNKICNNPTGGDVADIILDMAKASHRLAEQALAQELGHTSYLLEAKPTCSSVEADGVYQEFHSGLNGVMYFGGYESASVPLNGFSKRDLELMEYRVTAAGTDKPSRVEVLAEEDIGEFDIDMYVKYLFEDIDKQATEAELVEMGFDYDGKDLDSRHALAVEEFLSTDPIERLALLSGGLCDNSDIM